MPGLFDRIKDTTTYSGLLSVGTSFSVANAPSPIYQTFRNRYEVNDANIPVAIVGQVTNFWQVCWCTYTDTDTLRVDAIIFSSNGDNAITTSGTSDVFVTASSGAVAGLREINTFTANNYFTGGNVGIGTSVALTDKLRVQGGATVRYFAVLQSGKVEVRYNDNLMVGDVLTIANNNITTATHGAGIRFNFDTANGTGFESAYIRAIADDTYAAAANRSASIAFGTISGNTLAERMRIDNAGNVGIGTTSPSSQLHVVSATNFQPQIIADHVAGAGTGAAYFMLDRARGTPSARTAVASGDTLGTLMARGHDGSTVQNSAWLSFDVDGAVSSGNVPTGITFFTTPVGSSTAARLHIDADGNVGIGTTSPSDKLVVSGTSATAIRAQDATSYTQMYTNSGTGVLNNAGAGSLQLWNNGSERMRIDSSGNVGIGATSFSSRLHVDAGSQANGTDAIYFAKTRQSTNAVRYTFTDVGGLDSDGNGGAFWRGLHLASPPITVSGSGVFPRMSIFSNVNSLTDPTTRYWGLYAGNDPSARYSIAFFTADSARVWINGSDGNVGLRGITSPAQQFTLNAGATNETQAAGYSGATFLWGLGRESNSLNLDAFDAVTFRTGSSTGPRTGSQKASIGTARMELSSLFPLRLQTGSVTMDCTPTAGATDSFVWNTSANAHYIWSMAGTERARIDSSGNLLLGAASSLARITALNTSAAKIVHFQSAVSGTPANIDVQEVLTVSANAGVSGLTFAAGDFRLMTLTVTPNNEIAWRGNKLALYAADYIPLYTGGLERVRLTSTGDFRFEGTHPGPTSTTSIGYMGAPVNNQTTTYTLALTDAGKTVRKTGTTAFTVTIPADSTTNFPIGTCIILCNAEPSAGALNVTGATGVTMYTYTSSRQARAAGVLSPIAFGGSATIRKIAANAWAMSGAGVS